MADDKTETAPNLTDLDWIVNHRYYNHKSSLRIYNIIGKHRLLFSKSKGHRSTANILLGVAFSLWRAVFLVNLKQEKGSLLQDTEKFLKELIDSNTITYAVDRERKDWSFRYYMANARYRLNTLSSKFLTLECPFDAPISDKDRTPKQQWQDAQTSLEAAITSFESFLDAEAARKAFANVKRVRGKRHRAASEGEQA